MDKVSKSADEALDGLVDGMTVMSGGFGLCGNPEHLIAALDRRGVKDLHVISNNCGIDGKMLGVLLEHGRIRKITASYVGENRTFEQLYLDGKIEVDLTPQGTLAECIRAAGAGIAGFYTPTGYGTPVAEGKETRTFEGRPYVLERPLRADFALIKAWRGDRHGNLIYRHTANNFNQVMATAANITVAEVEELVEPGELDPNFIHTPSIYVDRLILGTDYEKPIEFRTVRNT